MNAIAFIFARGGSKGLPGKNILHLAGKPLIAWAIQHAKAVSRIRRVIISTDSSEIAQVALDFGGEVPFIRPASLATDNASEWSAWQHALKFVREDEGCWPNAMVSVPPTSPLRQPEDIERCLDEFEKGEADIVITVAAAHRNPCFNIVEMNQDGTVNLAMPSEKKIANRQDAPVFYDVTTVAYVADPAFVMSRQSIFAGRVRAVQVPVERAIDIDTRLDFETAEFLFSRQEKQCRV